MLRCWQLHSDDRPTFATLSEELDQHYTDVMESDMSDSSSPHYYLLSKAAYVNIES